MLRCSHMQSRYFLSPLLASSLLLGAGCQVRTSAPEAVVPTGEQPRQEQSAVATNTNCDHPYYPLRLGTKTSYATHYGTGHDSQLSWEVRALTNDKATLHYTFDRGLTMDSDISCGTDGLLAKTYLNMGSALTGSNVKAKTISSSGHFLPRDLQVGSTWTSTYEVEAENDNPDAARLGMKTTHMDLKVENKALGEESVTVPAGTFTALKIEAKNTMKMKLGPNLPVVNSTFTTYSYFVRGKGMVKSETSGASGMNSSMEATEIIVP